MSTAYNNRASRLAIVAETTGGTLKAPAAGTDFIAPRAGFDFSLQTESLKNDELRASIGATAPITGLESPSLTIPQWLKHSGTEGTAPSWNLLAKSLFGSTTANATERTMTTSSSVTVLHLASGGSDFSKGFAALIKDGTNGFNIRAIESISTNNLTMGFSVPVAPATGVKVGKCVNYTPVDSGNPTLSAWLYRANQADVEAFAGVLINEMTIEVNAGELMALTFKGEGTSQNFNPIIISASNGSIDFTDDDGTFAATVPVGVYRSPIELATAMSSAMDTANPLRPHTASYSNTTGKYTILTTGTVLSLLFLSGTNNATSIDITIGYTHTDKTSTAATTGYTGTNAITLTSPFTPSVDSSDPLVAKACEVLLGDQTNYVSLCVQKMTVGIQLTTSKVKCLSAVSGLDSIIPKERNAPIQITAVLSKFDADKFDRYINNKDVRFQFSFGVKSGGNWVAGKCGCVYASVCKVSAFKVGSNDDVVTIEITVTPYVDSTGAAEIYLNLL